MSKLETIVVRTAPKHPTGYRNRAGFTFTKAPLRVEVTAEQKKMIEDDRYLFIVTGGSALEQATDAKPIGSGKEEENVADMTKAQIIEKLTELGIEFDSRAKKDELLAQLQGYTPFKEEETDLSLLSVEEIIAKLTEKGLKEGTDFNADASKEDLIAMLDA